MLAHVPSFGRNPRGSPDFLAYPVPKACMHVLGTRVPRRLGVARSASSPKAAQALRCSLTPGLRISFGRVTCMARAASVPGLWTLGFLLLCGVCVWVRVVFGLGFRLRPATPGWGVGVGVCLCARSACTPPLLAGVCGVGVCAWARVSGAPRHSWLGCWRVCVFVCPLRLYPATPSWGVRRAPLVPRHSWLGCAAWVCVLWLGFQLRPATPGRGVGVCVCLCARSACTPPLLAGVCGVGVCALAWVSAAPRHSWLGCWGVCVFVCALRLYPTTPGWGVRRAPLVPRHSWLGCAVWVCVLWLGFRLRPATPGWGVGVCVCSCARSACTPPLLAGVCGVGVCALAWVSAAPRHSWLGCWGVCVFVCALRLYPATPGWGARRAPLVPRHSWLGCAVRVCVLWLGFRLRPATPGWGVGVCVCLCARSACTPPLLAGVCGVGVCALAWVSAAPRHSWLGCWGVCVLVRPLRLYPATPGWGVRCGCVCFGLGFGCAPPLLAGVLGCVCARAPAPLVPRHSWLGCAAWVCVLWLGFRLRPATPGWGVGVCACSCARSACTPPLLAGVCGVGVCALAWVSAAPRHSWLGCWGVCVLVRPLRLYPATPGWGVRRGCVCFGLGFGCAPPLLAGVLGCVRVRVRAPLVPRHSWLGCAARSACTPPLLAGVCGPGVCALAWVSAAPRHSWLGCWGVCVLVRPLRLYPATPGWGVRRGCVCFGLGFGCAPPLLAGVLGCVCARAPAPLVPRHSWLGCAAWVCVLWLGFRLRPATPGWGVGVCACSCAPSACTPPLLAGVCGALRLYPATPGWGVPRGCVCFGLGFGCAPPLLAGVLGCVCARAPAPLVPRHSWLGCAAWVCVLWLGFRLRPATPGWGVGVCACSCARSACTPPLLAGVCGVGVCALAWVSAAPRHSWLGCWGVCVLVRPLRLYPATPGWGVRRGCVCFGLGFGCAPPLLAGVLGCVRVRVRAPLVPRHSWLGCAARSACTPPLLAGVCGPGVCALAWVSAAPRHSWLGCWGVCVLVRPLRLYPATPGWGVRRGCVCFGLGFGCAPPLLAGVLGCVCARAPAPLVPRHSWLGCAAWVCVLWLGFRLRPATPGWGVGVCACSCAPSACTPPLLAGVCGALRLYPATPGWGVPRGCVCFGLGFGCAPPLLAGVLGCVCARAPAPLVPRHSWLGCAAWVCVLWLGFRLRPATPGWGVGVCACSCARSACTPPLLAGVCGALRLYPATPSWAVRRGEPPH